MRQRPNKPKTPNSTTEEVPGAVMSDLEAAETFTTARRDYVAFMPGPGFIEALATFRAEAREEGDHGGYQRGRLDHNQMEVTEFDKGFDACREQVASLFGLSDTAQLIAAAIRALKPNDE